ncbi:MAG: DEAD/DEAH box helicase [Anaerovoracaceae bacterium]
MKYEDSNINQDILKALKEIGFEDMTPIQLAAIPPLLEGKDIIGQAQTGTGKTAAFGIPLIQNIDLNAQGVQGIVLCPTRELAMQVTDEMRKYAKYIKGIKITAVFGGQDMQKQIMAVKGAKIVVGTPGRVMDHMRRRTLKLENIKMVVLDEADEMLNMGFKEDIETILTDTPEERQTALFSATMPGPILKITKKFQKNALHIKTEKIEKSKALIEQIYFEIKSAEKMSLLMRLMDYYDAKRTLIFCKTKRGADSLAGALKSKGYPAEPLHGDLSQGQRNAAMAQFRNGKAHIMIATDVAARGIDVDDVELVFNYDIPMEEEYYIHRIGRTGRAGRKGIAITFVVGKEKYKLRDIERYNNLKITQGTPPSLQTVMKVKSEKVFDKIIKLVKKEDLNDMKKLIGEKLDVIDISVAELAAALLKMEMGDTAEANEISVDSSKQRKEKHHSGKGGDRDRGGRRDYEKRGRRSGNGGNSGSERSSKKKDYEGSGEASVEFGGYSFSGKKGHDKKKSGGNSEKWAKSKKGKGKGKKKY